MSKIPESELAKLRKRIEQSQNFGQKPSAELRRRYRRYRRARRREGKGVVPEKG